MQVSELAGKRFGRLVVKERAPNQRGRTAWLCDCDCGAQATVVGHELGKRTKSCGCLRLELNRTRSVTHGMSKTPESRAFYAAKNRCTNPNFKQYKDYGGRGIEFRYNGFEEFLADVGRRPSPNHSLGRKENNGHYESGNCRWETSQQQFANRRVTLVSLESLQGWFGEAEGIRIWSVIRANRPIK